MLKVVKHIQYKFSHTIVIYPLPSSVSCSSSDAPLFSYSHKFLPVMASLKVFESRVLRRMFGPNRDGVTGEWRKLHNEELNPLAPESSFKC